MMDMFLYIHQIKRMPKAIEMIENIAKEVEVGEVYQGKVMRIANFGAFVELLPGKEGLVHISKLSHDHVSRVEDVVKVGDEITVKVTDIDEQGRITLSRKDVLPPPEKKDLDRNDKRRRDDKYRDRPFKRNFKRN